MACPARRYPLSQPKNYRPPVPRWTLKLPDDVRHVYTVYVGVQRHATDTATNTAIRNAVSQIESWLEDPADQAAAAERFRFLDGFDIPGTQVWVCYWADEGAFTRSLERLNLSDIYHSLGSTKGRVGLWCEQFSTAVSRLETNYSGFDHPDYLPGLAKLPETSTYEHTYSAYWGAARDRIPDSGVDLFEPEEERSLPPERVPKAVGERLAGSNFDNMVHIRSGQFWENCAAEERGAYETNLEPALRAGMKYLWENPLDTRTLGLRFLRNKDVDDEKKVLKETCAAGFFRSLGDLETWSKRHPSHLAIFNGALRHAKVFGQQRKFRTWHEVSVLKEREAHFEYVNCTPNTGVIRFVKLEAETL